MEQPAVRSRTSPSSTLGCLRYAECFLSLPVYTTLSEALTKKGRLLCLVIRVLRGDAWSPLSYALGLLVVVIGDDHRVM